jgi:hypothetical protein
MHFARFLFFVKGDVAAARQVYERAVELSPTNATLLLAQIEFERSQLGDVESGVRALFERALTNTEGDIQTTLWQLYVSFMQDRSCDLSAIEQVESRASRASISLGKPTSKPMKRKAPASSLPDEQPTKQGRTDGGQ